MDRRTNCLLVIIFLSKSCQWLKIGGCFFNVFFTVILYRNLYLLSIAEKFLTANVEFYFIHTSNCPTHHAIHKRTVHGQYMV